MLKYIVMICSKAPLSSQFTFYIYGKEIEIVSSLEYLGLHGVRV